MNLNMASANQKSEGEFKNIFCYLLLAVCGGEIEVDSSGHLESPNYPDDYQPNKLCIWRLSVPQVRKAIPHTNFVVIDFFC